MAHVVAYSFNLNILEVEVGEFLWVQGQFGLHSKFQDSQGYLERPIFLKSKERKEKKKKKASSIYLCLLQQHIHWNWNDEENVILRRMLAWHLHLDDMQIHEVFHVKSWS